MEANCNGGIEKTLGIVGVGLDFASENPGTNRDTSMSKLYLLLGIHPFFGFG